MSNLAVRALIYQFVCFGLLFLLCRWIIAQYTGVSGWWIPFTAAVVSTLIGPQFKAVQSRERQQLLLFWWPFKSPKKLG